MSLKKYARHEFLRLKDCGPSFTFVVHGWREMTTKFGTGFYLIGERVIKKKTDKQLKGLLKMSPTTISSILEHTGFNTEPDGLEGKLIDFEFNEDARTILAVAVREWSE